MKKLALVLGSLLAVSSMATAKEVVPAPVAAPEVQVKEVVKEVVVYKDREVAPKWRPTGYVELKAKTKGTKREVVKDDEKEHVKTKGWKSAELRTRAEVQFTPNQKLRVEYKDNFGYRKEAAANHSIDASNLLHTYDFGKMGNVGVSLESKFSYNTKLEFAGYDETIDARQLKERVKFDFADYFFKNDYVKATSIVLAPEYAYTWNKNGHMNTYGLYADLNFELPYGVGLEAEFDDLFAYNRAKVNREKGSLKLSSMELTLTKDVDLYKAGAHTITFGNEAKYATDVNWSAKDGDKKVPSHKFTYEPSVKYAFQATDYVNLWAKVGYELGYERVKENREDTTTKTRWAQPYAEVGFKTTF